MATEKMAGPGSRTPKQLGLWRQADDPFRLSAQGQRELLRLLAELLVGVLRRRPVGEAISGRREP